MSLQTANWNYLGNQFYKKFEICQMLWNGIINLEDYVIAAAPYGGPIGMRTVMRFDLFIYCSLSFSPNED